MIWCRELIVYVAVDKSKCKLASDQQAEAERDDEDTRSPDRQPNREGATDVKIPQDRRHWMTSLSAKSSARQLYRQDKKVIKLSQDRKWRRGTQYHQTAYRFEKTKKKSRFHGIGGRGRRRAYDNFTSWSLSRRYAETSQLIQIGSTEWRRVHDIIELLHMFS